MIGRESEKIQRKDKMNYEVNYPNVPKINTIKKHPQLDLGMVKMEWLITRKCPLKCTGCTMIEPQDVRPQLDKEGIEVVALCAAKLGIPFAAIYGAEPLALPIDHLETAIKTLEENNVMCTLITSGTGMTIKQVKNTIERLWDAGLRSLTMSCDAVNPNTIEEPSIKAKSKRTEEIMLWWIENYKNCRDGQITFTVTPQNYRQAPEFVKKWSERGVYTAFDIYHVSCGQEGSKCGPYYQGKEQLFYTIDKNGEKLLKPELEDSKKVFSEIREMHDTGFLIFCNPLLLDMWKNGIIQKHDWACNPTTFITVGTEGTVWFCDDFQPRSKQQNYFIWELLNESIWEKFLERNIRWMEEEPCRCAWGTHIAAEQIFNGLVDISGYVHGIGEDNGN